jgi:hypothetical protein
LLLLAGEDFLVLEAGLACAGMKQAAMVPKEGRIAFSCSTSAKILVERGAEALRGQASFLWNRLAPKPVFRSTPRQDGRREQRAFRSPTIWPEGCI